MTQLPFDTTGFASLDDIESDRWKAIFPHLEKVQQEFTRLQFHGVNYRWPREPLYNFIRVWEYPFVYQQFAALSSTPAKGAKTVADLGSGATFFPFAVARLGFDVRAIDTDEAAEQALQRAIGTMPAQPGTIRFLRSDIAALPLDDGSLDHAYCISVLEHLPEPWEAIREVRRVLKPGGLFVLTFDVSERSNHDLQPAAYSRLLETLQDGFVEINPRRIVHPSRVLNTYNSIYPLYLKRTGISRAAREIRKRTRLALGKTDPEILVSTYGVTLRRTAA
jgi:ubiquinone/menaquinone biosynthesis C-methylase UbiE